MDKLTTEQKAQRYDEVLERVVNIRTGKCETTFIFTEGLFNYLFPELEENNGEEVREAMIDFFKHEREEGVVVSHYGVNIERMIAWLEKQGQVNETIISQHEDKICKENNDSLTSEDERIRKDIKQHFLYLDDSFPDKAKWLTWLEKQDKKPADRVKPKFQKGDWITNGYDTWEIIEVKPLAYILQSQDGNIEDDTISYIDETYDSFTIEDAKDGDVLADNVGVILFKSIGDNNVINYYAYFSGLFAVQEGEHYWGHIRECTLSPATKEQRERFFAAMNDAGWEFDFEKKELKKISQRMISAEAKEAMYGKPAWSGEDETRIKNILSVLDAQVCWHGATGKKGNPYQKEIDWLKSLQQRIGDKL